MGALHSIAISIFILVMNFACGWPLNTTLGFTDLPFNTSHYRIQKPYNLPLNQRYSFKHGIHKLWVHSTDKPLRKNSPTKPRTEIIISGYNYSSGVWQFEGHGYVPRGTTGVSIMQVFGGSSRATTFMLRVYNGSLTAYSAPVIVNDIYGRWFRLNVVHDVNASNVKVYIDGVYVYEAPGSGGTFHYFKFGVYAQNYDSFYMESRWKKIKVFKKCD